MVKLLNHVTSANVACGWHAGDPLGIRMLQCAYVKGREGGVAVGAHPGYPDLMGFWAPFHGN